MKRLGIFCVYDKDGIVDDYIVYLLQEVKKVLTHLMIICNGEVSSEGKAKLRRFTDDFVIRPNEGFDIGAWRQGILKHAIAFSDYDELLLFNDSFYGPFYPCSEIFAKMDNENPDADFWGMTIHRRLEDDLGLCPYGYLPEHIQSYFLVIRKRLLHDERFLEYWQNSELPQTMDQAVRQHEVCFTKHFSDLGFNYAVYCDTRKLEEGYNVSVNQYIMSSELLLRKYACPFLKKKTLLVTREAYLLQNYGDGPRKSLEFIKKNTNYDMSLIWKNVLRLQNIALTKSTLGLNYIFHPDVCRNTKKTFSDTAIIAHLYYEDLMPECVQYLCNVPCGVSIFVTVNSEDKKKIVAKLFDDVGRYCEVRVVPARGRDLSALLVGCNDVLKNFKYVCFTHDKKSMRPNDSICIGRAFFHLLWDNTLHNENFIRQIVETFEDEPNLGLLAPPHPYHGEYRSLFPEARYWSGACYEKTQELAERLNIPKNLLDLTYAPPALGSVFWFRTAAVKKLIDEKWRIKDFAEEPMPIDGTISHALERIFPFAAQTEGFYTGWVMTDGFAKDEIENLIQLQLLNRPIVQQIPAVVQMVKNRRWVALKELAKQIIPQKYWKYLRPVKDFLERHFNS